MLEEYVRARNCLLRTERKKKKGPKKPQKMRREWLEVMGSGWRGRQRSDHAGNQRIKYKLSNTVYMP